VNERKPVVMWFRQDLRLSDNPALTAAAETERSLIPIYVLDDADAGEWAMGGASRWWLHQSLMSLNDSLQGRLRVFRGDAAQIVTAFARETDVCGVYWNRCYEPWRIARDTEIEKRLVATGCDGNSFNGSLLFEPPDVVKADGTPYKVFTPFYRKGCMKNSSEPRVPLPVPALPGLISSPQRAGIEMPGPLPAASWHNSIAENWTPGEEGGLERLERFLENGIRHYSEGRDRPDQNYVSRLSPHLHFGEVSPNQAWHAASPLKAFAGIENHVDHFHRELGWREFSHHLLYHWPEMTRENLQSKFDRFPWRDDPDALRRWQRGATGYPIVDAGMRELWQTGYMHNRVRMIVGSFLVKNLMLHWHHGEDWFWDTLVDADLANNSASWQWIAGCGADAAPFFRIFNPVTQGQKFDPDGLYVRRYVPELAHLANKFLHRPWEAPAHVLQDAQVQLGRDYPEPVVDLRASRERALDAFKALKRVG
jgi:deoxyribodipyrimidine photo-lyase